jgi:cysteinyl-tRNA synthetase
MKPQPVLHDTMSRQKRPLNPCDGERYRFYCCGPTVYGPAHIGNFRTFVVQDVLRRVLELAGLNPVHMRNITNVDDKTIRESQAEARTLQEFTQEWTERFNEDSDRLNLLTPHKELGAVESIPEQIELIQTLVDKGHAYQTEDGSVYFRIDSFEPYGKLSRLSEREITTSDAPAPARVDDDEYDDEHSAADFALWKGRKPEDGPNFWQSPWGEGRPGWHTECSAMSMSYLGETFDLHSGGEDLIFPHHENEIAQSEAATGKPFALHWFHIAHLLVEGKKMAKSQGNFFTLGDLLEKGYSPMELRYTLLSGLYRRSLNFTFDGLNASRHALQRIRKFDALLGESSGKTPPPGAGVSGLFADTWAALLDDLNVPKALGELFSAIKEGTAKLNENPTDDERRAMRDSFDAVLFALGFVIETPEETTSEIPDAVAALAEKRWAARIAKDWAAADQLRDELAAAGWSMKDGRDAYELMEN